MTLFLLFLVVPLLAAHEVEASIANISLYTLFSQTNANEAKETEANEDGHRSLSPQSDNKETIQIGVYNNIIGYLNWQEPWFTTYAATKCNTKCLFSLDPSAVNKADIVVFLASTFQRRRPLFPKKAKKTTVFVLHTMEQPLYATMLTQAGMLRKNFDLIATYNQDPTYPNTGVPSLPLTYFPLHVYDPEYLLTPPLPFSEKTGYGTGVDVAVFISNCKKAGGANRLKYVKEMMEYIPMHSYGGCLGNRKEKEIPYDDRWPKHDQRRARKHKTLSQYKFYLAFENTGVRDYVSEKVYDALIGGTLPVYRGAEGIRKFMPDEHSFVNGNGMSPKELADVLIHLGQNEQEYNKYFEWKNHPLDPNFKEMTERSYTHPKVLCRLCDYAAMKKHEAGSRKLQLRGYDNSSQF